MKHNSCVRIQMILGIKRYEYEREKNTVRTILHSTLNTLLNDTRLSTAVCLFHLFACILFLFDVVCVCGSCVRIGFYYGTYKRCKLFFIQTEANIDVFEMRLFILMNTECVKDTTVDAITVNSWKSMCCMLCLSLINYERLFTQTKMKEPVSPDTWQGRFILEEVRFTTETSKYDRLCCTFYSNFLPLIELIL